MLLEGKTAIVTGASGGIGKAVAIALAKEGAAVAVHFHGNEEKALLVKKEIEEAGGKAEIFRANVADFEECNALVKAAAKTFGSIDILVNNAGSMAYCPTTELTLEAWDKVVRLSITGYFLMARECAKSMIKNHYGRIINIASMYGLVGNMAATCVPYHAAKGGVVNMTRALAAEWGKEGITVNSICPGYFITPLTKETLDSDWFTAYAKGAIPVGRYGNEGELDTCALFLASSASSYVNGQNIAVDGGYTAI